MATLQALSKGRVQFGRGEAERIKGGKGLEKGGHWSSFLIRYQ